jgi:hypothetical protein
MMVYGVIGELLKKLQNGTSHAEQLLELSHLKEMVTT